MTNSDSAAAFLGVGFHLTHVKSPDVTFSEELDSSSSGCGGFDFCGSCTNDGDCGFCYVAVGGGSGVDDVANGSCVAVAE